MPIVSFAELPSVEVDGDERKVRPSDQQFPLPLRTRCIIILRNVPSDASESEISDLFVKGHCPASAIEYERVLESDHSDCWYVTFANEDEAQNAFIYLTRENVAIRGQKILARMKSRLWQKSVPPTESNGSHQPADETKNNAPLPPSPRYTFVYLQPTVSSQSNQSTLLNNIQQPQGPANNYRPVQILPSPYLPGNYNTYLPYDRNGWTTAVHPSNVPSILSYSTAAQQAHLNSYPASFHPMMPQVASTNHVFISIVSRLAAFGVSNKLLVHPIDGRFLSQHGKQSVDRTRPTNAFHCLQIVPLQSLIRVRTSSPPLSSSSLHARSISL